MALTLLRHTTPQVQPGTCYGMTDLDLKSSFATEAHDILADLPGFKGFVCSPLSRCHRLATVLGAAQGVPVRVDEDWREMDFGAWEGQLWDQIDRAALDAWAADFRDYTGHGGESVAQLETRVRRALFSVPDGFGVVTHMGCIKAACAIHTVADGWDTKLSFGRRITLP